MAGSHNELRYYVSENDDDGIDDDEEMEEEEEEDHEEENNSHDCKNMCGGNGGRHGRKGIGLIISGLFSRNKVIDPRAQWVQEWNRVFLLVCGIGLFVDPLFFYAVSISESCMCLFVDGWFALTVTVLRCMTDTLHVWNMWLQFKMIHRRTHHIPYFKVKKGFFFDLFVILPLTQLVMWVGIPALLEKGSTTTVMTVLLITFLFQYLPKIYHSVCLLRRMQNLSGYIFGTVWWGIALNIIAYFVASHAVGACWYLLGIQRAAKCMKEQCGATKGCGLNMLACKESIYYGTTSLMKERSRLMWGEYSVAKFVGNSL